MQMCISSRIPSSTMRSANHSSLPRGPSSCLALHPQHMEVLSFISTLLGLAAPLVASAGYSLSPHRHHPWPHRSGLCTAVSLLPLLHAPLSSFPTPTPSPSPIPATMPGPAARPAPALRFISGKPCEWAGKGRGACRLLFIATLYRFHRPSPPPLLVVARVFQRAIWLSGRGGVCAAPPRPPNSSALRGAHFSSEGGGTP